MRISDWSSDVCSSDLYNVAYPDPDGFNDTIPYRLQFGAQTGNGDPIVQSKNWQFGIYLQDDWEVTDRLTLNLGVRWDYERTPVFLNFVHPDDAVNAVWPRSEEHTSELKSLMRRSEGVLCLNIQNNMYTTIL